MQYDRIDIDERLTTLWEELYDAIINIVNSHNLKERKIMLPKCEIIEFILVTFDDVIMLGCNTGMVDCAENLDDRYLYDAYNGVYGFLEL